MRKGSKTTLMVGKASDMTPSLDVLSKTHMQWEIEQFEVFLKQKILGTGTVTKQEKRLNCTMFEVTYHNTIPNGMRDDITRTFPQVETETGKGKEYYYLQDHKASECEMIVQEIGSNKMVMFKTVLKSNSCCAKLLCIIPTFVVIGAGFIVLTLINPERYGNPPLIDLLNLFY